MNSLDATWAVMHLLLDRGVPIQKLTDRFIIQPYGPRSSKTCYVKVHGTDVEMSFYNFGNGKGVLFSLGDQDLIDKMVEAVDDVQKD